MSRWIRTLLPIALLASIPTATVGRGALGAELETAAVIGDGGSGASSGALDGYGLGLGGRVGIRGQRFFVDATFVDLAGFDLRLIIPTDRV